MPPEPCSEHGLSRRAFLRAGAGLGLAAAGASLLNGLDVLPALAASRPPVALPFSSDLYASPTAQRFSLILEQATSNGIKYVSGPPVKVRFRPPGGSWQKFTSLRLDTEGLPKGRGIYRSEFVFDKPGKWKGEARFSGTSSTFTLGLPTNAVAPIPGQPAPRAASPTTTNSLGVNPICTRDPQCPLHERSLSDVIGSGRPVAVLFATPARCQSAYCGPVLDELLKVIPPYQDKVDVVHVEIYANLNDDTLAPTVEAWKLPSEPWLYGIDGSGTITARLDTAFGKPEMVALLDSLSA